MECYDVLLYFKKASFAGLSLTPRHWHLLLIFRSLKLHLLGLILCMHGLCGALSDNYCLLVIKNNHESFPISYVLADYRCFSYDGSTHRTNAHSVPGSPPVSYNDIKGMVKFLVLLASRVQVS